MRRVLALLLLVPFFGNPVTADLGLNVTVPGLVSGMTNAVGQGVIALIKANGTIKNNAELDPSGGLTTLVLVVNNVTSPLNKLLGTALSVSSSKTPNDQRMFASISSLTSDTETAVGKALIAAQDLQRSIRPLQFDEIQENISMIISNLPILQDAFTVLSTTVSLAQNSEFTNSTRIVNDFFPESIVNTVINPVRAITDSVNRLAKLVTAVAKDKMVALNVQTGVNTTLNNNYKIIRSAITAFNRTSSDVNSTTVKYGYSIGSAIDQLYNSITSRPQNYNGGDISNLNTFLSDVKSYLNYSNDNITEALSQLQQNVTTMVNLKTNQTAQLLLDTAQNLSIQAYTSGSDYADRCIGKYSGQLNQNPLLVNRVASACLQSENDNFGAITRMHRMLLDQTKTLAGSGTATILSRQCSQGLSSCMETHFTSFQDLSQRVSEKLQLSNQLIEQEIQAIQSRIETCTTAVAGDIADNTVQVQTKFTNCLTSGS
ncbi:uncharacterized protein LOC129732429 [Wyeomyia smithii]|uniref:uncharacterized protein LOC129732429 n=1 Tax=Wyeomyia smithii TaxID=174621 RepID=UPI002467C17D|nr:uncharacterized protein LOC129732429 [Wyeomyia smithii]